MYASSEYKKTGKLEKHWIGGEEADIFSYIPKIVSNLLYIQYDVRHLENKSKKEEGTLFLLSVSI